MLEMTLPAGAINPLGGTGTDFVLNESNTTLVLYNAYGSAAFIDGNNDTVVFNWRGPWGGNSDRIADNGQGTTLVIGNGSASESPIYHHPLQSMQVYDFQHDKAGMIDVNSPWYSLGSDGHGGTMMHVEGGQYDFVGDPHISASQIHFTV